MSGFETILLAAASAAGTMSSIAQAGQQQKMQRQAQALQMQQAQSEISALEQQRADAEEDRRKRLERATASQRAAFAAGGVSSDGSGEAVFGNLLSETDEERNRMNADIDRRIAGLQSGIQMNLLSRTSRQDGFGKFASMAQAGSQLVNAGRQLHSMIS